jgi:hypothetical protein
MPAPQRQAAELPRRQEVVNSLCALAGLCVAGAALAIGIAAALRGRNSDFNCFFDAGVAALEGKDLYASGGYIYPPLLAVLIAPLTLLGRTGAAVVWCVLNAGLVIFLARASAGATAAAFPAASAAPRQRAAAAGLAIVVLASTLLQELRDGNCDMLVVAAVVLAQRWLGRRPVLCGVALGMAISIKYLPLVFLPYLLLRRRWWELLSAAASTALFALLPALRFGWDQNLRFLGTAYAGLLQMAGGHASVEAASIHPLAWRNSISLPSVIARAAEAVSLPPASAWAATLVLAGAAAGVVVWMYRRAGLPIVASRAETAGTRAMTAIEWPGLLYAALIFGPQTVPRHANMALPFVAAACWLMLRDHRRAKPRLAVPLAAVFVATFLRFWLDRADGPIEPWRAIGGLSWCLLALGLAVVAESTRAAREAPPPTSLPAS